LSPRSNGGGQGSKGALPRLNTAEKDKTYSQFPTMMKVGEKKLGRRDAGTFSSKKREEGRIEILV